MLNPTNNANFWALLEYLTHYLRQEFSSAGQASNFQSNLSQFPKSGNLLLLTGTVDHLNSSHSSNSPHSFLLEIKVVLTVFKEKPSLVFVFSDITERNLVTVLQENNNYKDRLLASVSHELRTPLNASINFTQSAIEHPALATLPDVRDNYLMPALRSNQLLLHLINDILDFSQMSANKLRLVYENKNASETLDECINLVKIQATRKGLTMSSEFVAEDGKSEFCTDHNRLKQIVLNLLSNALKFTLKGDIRISAKIAITPPSARWNSMEVVAPMKKHRVLSVSVRDTGIGISEENKRKLFKAFEKIELGDRISINSQGVGLGLVISNNLVLMLGPEEQNNGMKVESEENRGTTFSFWIVEQQGSIDQRLDNSSYSKSENVCSGMEEHNNSFNERIETLSNIAPIKGMDKLNSGLLLLERIKTGTPLITNTLTEGVISCPKILVVDDDIFNISALQLILNQLGYSCSTAYNGQQAIERVLERESENQSMDKKTNIMSKSSIQYRLIFMDCSMPIMDGLEATRILKTMMRNEEIENINIVACTAYLNEKEKMRAMEYGIDGYCIKPLDKEGVRNLVRKYVPNRI